jgi:hypothetical protein
MKMQGENNMKFKKKMDSLLSIEQLTATSHVV